MLRNIGRPLPFGLNFGLPVLRFDTNVTKAEGNSGSTAFTFTLNLTRNGFLGVINYNWSVVGSGSNPASASDFVGGVLPSGSGSLGTGVLSQQITVLVQGDSEVEFNENFTLTVAPSISSSTFSLGTILNDDVFSTTPMSLSPAGTWTGVDGTGGTAPTVTGTPQVADPVSGFMTVPAVVGNFINPPGYYYPIVADEDLHVMAYAEGGIASVTFYCEGNTIAVTTPVIRPITYGTRTESLPVYTARLKHSAFPQDGTFAVYATLKANDSTIADRVIGPMLYRRKTGSAFYEIQVKPGTGTDVAGQVYYGPTAIWKAHAWYRANSQTDVWIWADEAFEHDYPTSGTWNIGASKGTLLIKPKPGGRITVSANSIATDAAAVSGVTFKTTGLILDNLIIDCSRIITVVKDGTRPVILINCEVKGAGRTELFGSSGRLTGTLADKQPRVQSALSANTHMLYGCKLSDNSGIGRSVTRSVFTTFNNVSNDLHSPSTGNGFLMIGTRATNFVCSDLKQQIPSMSLYHNGVGGSATYQVSGATNSTTRTLTLRVGSYTQTIVASTTAGSGIYTFTDAVAAINAETANHGITATVLNDRYRYSWLNGSTTLAQTAISTSSTAPTNILSWIDVHQDIIQLGDGFNYDNLIIYGAKVANPDGIAQSIFLKTITGEVKNVLVANNSISNGPAIDSQTIFKCQLWGVFSHLSIINNTVPNQELMVRGSGTTFDQYSRVAQNVFTALNAPDSTPANLKVTHNHFINGVVGLAANSWLENGTTIANNTTGESTSTLLSDWANLAYNPIGTLLNTTVPKILEADINGAARSAQTLKGSVSTPKPTLLAPFFDNFDQPLGKLYARPDWTVQARTVVPTTHSASLEVTTAGDLSGSVGISGSGAIAYHSNTFYTTVSSKLNTLLGTGYMAHHVSVFGDNLTYLRLAPSQTTATAGFVGITPVINNTASTSTIISGYRFENGDVFTMNYFQNGDSVLARPILNGRRINNTDYDFSASGVPITGKFGFTGAIPASSVASFSVADPFTSQSLVLIAPYRTVQINNLGNLIWKFSATYTQPLTSLKYRLFNNNTKQVVSGHDGVLVSNFSASNGVATFGLQASPPVPAGPDYYVEVYQDGLTGGNGLAVAQGPTQRGGHVVVHTGQSNSVNVTAVTSTTISYPTVTNCFKIDGTKTVAIETRRQTPVVDNTPVAAEAASFVAATGYPVTIVQTGLGGTSAIDRSPGNISGIHDALLDGLDHAGGRILCLVDDGGEAEVGKASTWKPAMDAIHDAIDAKIGYQVPVVICPIGSFIAASASDAGVEEMRRTQWKATRDNPTRYKLGPCKADLEHQPIGTDTGGLHYSNQAYAYHRSRQAKVSAFIAGASSASFAGPQLVSAQKVDSSTINVTVALNGFDTLEMSPGASVNNDWRGGLRFATTSNFASPLSPISVSFSAASGGQVVATYKFSGTPFGGSAFVSGPYGKNPFNPSNTQTINENWEAQASILRGTKTGFVPVAIQPYYSDAGDYIQATTSLISVPERLDANSNVPYSAFIGTGLVFDAPTLATLDSLNLQYNSTTGMLTTKTSAGVTE